MIQRNHRKSYRRYSHADARWLGYRIGYEDLCKIYMPREV
ncbi:Z1 domain-containing protein [Helicobacter suis]